jgi:hypothetical protein
MNDIAALAAVCSIPKIAKTVKNWKKATNAIQAGSARIFFGKAQPNISMTTAMLPKSRVVVVKITQILIGYGRTSVLHGRALFFCSYRCDSNISCSFHHGKEKYDRTSERGNKVEEIVGSSKFSSHIRK